MFTRSPESCLHRESPTAGGLPGCRLAGVLVGGASAPAVPVATEACEACCRRPEPSPGRLNEVVASLVVGAAAARGVALTREVGRALRTLAEAEPAGRSSRPEPCRRLRIGLVGWNDATGLGSVSRDLAVHGAVERWLVPRKPGRGMTRLAWPEGLPAGCRVETLSGGGEAEALRTWLRGLDWVVFAETPVYDGLVAEAKALGVGVACVPMWEWTDPWSDWLPGVDLMICPTVHCLEEFADWKARYGFGWRLEHVPWPVDTNRFAFRRRGVCRRFVFVNGRGGSRGWRAGWTRSPYRRKGLEVMIEAARELPGVPFLVHSLVPLTGVDVPPNVEVRDGGSDRNERLYDEGDVCVQPSRWEGIGLPLLECQAAGMPLVTTDAAPMNEFMPLRAVAADTVETVTLVGSRPVAAHLVSPERLAETLRSLVGVDVGRASEEARAFVELVHSWDAGAGLLRKAFEVRPDSSR